jgi:HPt (histidine-containing phosphotransfer) domain-containing protein
MVDHELDELRREFLGEAGEKVAEMESLDLSAGATSLERLAYLAHQLKGSGGSYGFPSISTDAAALEQAIETAGASASAGTELQPHVRRLRDEIDRCRRSFGD